MVPVREVDVEEWQALVEKGRAHGSVHAEDVTMVLRHVELTGDVLDRVKVGSAISEIPAPHPPKHIRHSEPLFTRCGPRRGN